MNSHSTDIMVCGCHAAPEPGSALYTVVAWDPDAESPEAVNTKTEGDAS